MKSSTHSFKSFGGWFSPTLMKKNLTRFWPIWAIYAAGLLFLLPMSMLSDSRYYWGEHSFVVTDDALRSATQSAPVIGAVFGIVAAMALFSYLMSPRSCQMLHSLPVRREGLFLTNWLSGLWFCLVPNLVIFFITLLVGLALGSNLILHLLVWLAVETGCCMFFFCFAVFCAMFTGNLLALPVFYGILNVLVMGVCALIDSILPTLLVGFPGSGLSGSDFARWCTPVYQLAYQIVRGGGEDQLFYLDYSATGITTVLCYCLVLGVAFTLVALWVYRLRQLERAGDLVTVGWVRPVFQFGLGTCVGLALGLFIYDRFFYGAGAWVLITFIVLMGVVGAFAGRMLLKKTLRVFTEGWKSVAAFAAALAVLLGGARADLFGYQRWTPQPEQVQMAELTNVYSSPWDSGEYGQLYFRDPELIAQVVELHREMTEDLTQADNWWGSAMGVYYTMDNGERARRWYDGTPITAEALEDPESFASRFQELINRPESVRQLYFGSFLPEDVPLSDVEAAEGWLESLVAGAAEQEQMEFEWNGEGPVPADLVETKQVSTSGDLTSADLSGEEARRLWTAIQEDLAAGNIGRRYLLDDEVRMDNCYITDVTLTLVYNHVDDDGERRTVTRNVSFTVQKSAVETLKVLDELGYTERLKARSER